MNTSLKQGINPLSYLGVGATTPPMMIVEQRDPTDNDYAGYEVGSLWVVTSVPKMWLMINKNPSATDKWVQVYPGDGSGTNFFETNSGIASENAGTIKIKGSAGGVLTSMSILDQVSLNLDDDVVIVNSLTVNTMSEGVVVADSGGLLSCATGTDLQFLVGETGNAPSFATLVSEDFTVTITNGTVPGTVNIQAVGGGGGSGFAGLIGENSVVATPSAEKVTVSGDEYADDVSNIYTEASGHKINIFHSDMLNLGETTSNGKSGVIKLDGNIYFSAYGNNNLFLGKESGSLTLNVISAERNVGIGTYVLRDIDTSINNTAVGFNCLASLDSGGGGNCCLGYECGSSLQTGEGNILIGQAAGYDFTSNESNNIIIGDASGSAGMDNTTVIGNLSTSDCYVTGIYGATGLGSTNGAVLVDDDNKLVSSRGTTGQVLTSTATGVTWATATPPTPTDSWTYTFIKRGLDSLQYVNGYWFNYGALPGPTYVLYATATPLVPSSWVEIDKGDTTLVYKIYYLNNTWIIQGNNNKFYYTSNLLGTWSTVTIPFTSPITTFSTLSFDGTYFGISGNRYSGGFYDTEFYTATSMGGTWTKNASFVVSHATYSASVAFYGTHWIAITGDYKLWTATNPTGSFTLNSGASNAQSPIYYGNNKWCYTYTTGGSMYIFSTSNPTGAWTSFLFPFGVGSSPTFKFVGNVSWAVIDEGNLYMADDPAGTWAFVPTNISDGSTESSEYGSVVKDVTFSLNKYVAVGFYGYISSASSVTGTWAKENSGTTYKLYQIVADATGTFGYRAGIGVGFKSY